MGSEIPRAVVVLVFALSGLAVSGCRPSLSADNYSRVCATDEDCSLAAIDDVCSCFDDPIAVVDAERAREDAQAAQAWCTFGVEECVMSVQAACEDGMCVTEPISE